MRGYDGVKDKIRHEEGMEGDSLAREKGRFIENGIGRDKWNGEWSMVLFRCLIL